MPGVDSWVDHRWGEDEEGDTTAVWNKMDGDGREGQRVVRSPGFYTFVRHLGKMGPSSSLLFLTVKERKGSTRQEETEDDG